MSYVPAISQMSISAEQAYGSVSAISGFVAVSIAMMNSQRKTIDYYTSIIQKKIDIINALRDVKNHFGMDKGGENDKVGDKSNKATDVSSDAVEKYLDSKGYSKDVINTVLKILDPSGSNLTMNGINALQEIIDDLQNDGSHSITKDALIKELTNKGLNYEDASIIAKAAENLQAGKQSINIGTLTRLVKIGTTLENNTALTYTLLFHANIILQNGVPSKDEFISKMVEEEGQSKAGAENLYNFLKKFNIYNKNGADILHSLKSISINEVAPWSISKNDLNDKVQDAVETLQSENQINLIKFQAAIRNFETTVNAASQTIATDKQISLQIGGRI